ncbi:MAG: AI-2E family transporter [Gammaproteobacteria bacterium]
MDQPHINVRLVHSLIWLVVIVLILSVLAIAKDFLIPFVIAVFFWYLINVLAQTYGMATIGGRRMPPWLCYALSGATFLILIRGLIFLISSNVHRLIAEVPIYQKNLTLLFKNMLTQLDIEDTQLVSQFINDLNLGGIMTSLATNMASLFSNLILITIYLIFIFLEQRYFLLKMDKAVAKGPMHDNLLKVFRSIDADIRTYIGVKTLISLLTAVLSYIVMRSMDLNFANFWALMIFILNYIPSIGSIVATILPSLLALVQFDTVTPFWVIFLSIAAIQVVIGNILDPNLMGHRLNISPLVIILSLLLWGFIWGVPGMFLGVPLMVMLMIVLYNFEETRWLGIMLSKDGKMRM